ncbi:MAG: cupin domain-containing protein [Synergistaceae bacterium]|nr:cupin domain-containing protein [Synergistaceae bacterium]
MKGLFVKHDDTELQDLGGGSVRRVLAWNEQIMAVEMSCAAGAEVQPHKHPHTQCCYVLSGRFKYSVEGETFEVGAGDSGVVPGGAVHGLECVEPGMLVEVFTPMRQDFLKQ